MSALSQLTSAKLGTAEVFRILSAVPLFSELDETLRLNLARRMIPLAFRAGSVVVSEGGPPDALYVVVSGRLRASVLRDDKDIFVGEIGRGETIGEMGLLTEEPRAATVRTIRDSILLRLSKVEFMVLVETHPSALTGLTRLVIQRLRRSLGSAPPTTSIRTIAIVPAGRDANVPLEFFSNRLAGALGKIGRTMLLNRERLTSQLNRLDDLKSLGERTLIRREGLRALTGDRRSAELNDPGFDTKITEWLHNVETSNDIVVYQADPTRTPWTIRCLRQADRILLVGRAEGDPELGELEKDLFERHVLEIGDSSWRERELVLLHGVDAEVPTDTERWLQRRPVQRHFHCRLTSEAHFARLGRVLTGTHVSLVLSGGGARGAAHVGVLKALEEHNIPIDVIGGTSFGAIMAAGPALGWNAEQLRRGIRRTLVDPGRPLDFTGPYCALTTGQKATRQIRSIFKDFNIEDLWLPYFCVSSNISRGEPCVHERGPLWRAIRSSVAIPGILPPVKSPEGDVLIDGAVMNNLPVDVMRQRTVGGRILAVNLRAPVRLPTEDLTDGGVLPGWRLLVRWVNPFSRRPSVPSIVDLILRTAETGNILSSQLQESSADLIFRPAVDKFRLLDFESYDQLIEAGYVEAMVRLEELPGLSPGRFRD